MSETVTTSAYESIISRAITRAAEAPKPPAGGTLHTFKRQTTGFFTALAAYAEANYKAGHDKLLSGEGKAKLRKELRQKMEQQAAGIISSLRYQADSYRTNLEETAAPANVPTEDRLANARSDAKLALDGEPADKLHIAVKELATDGDSAMTYLLCFTPWVGYYARARKDKHLPTIWDKEKYHAMAELLTEEGMAAYQSLDAAYGLAEIPGFLRDALWIYLKDTGQPVPDRAVEFLAQ